MDREGPGLLAGPVIEVIAAGAFHLPAPVMRYSAMQPAWMLFWICFASWSFAFLPGFLALFMCSTRDRWA